MLCKHHYFRMANTCVYIEKNFLNRWITSLKGFGKFLQKTVKCENDLTHVIRFVLPVVLESFVVIFLSYLA